MLTQTKAEIYVPALVKVVVPEVCLGDVEYRTNAQGEPLSAAEYFEQMQLPTLAELRRAFFDTHDDGSVVSPEYRRNVLSNRGKGERTATFLKDGRQIIERPEKVYYDEGRGIWIAEGGIVTDVELPDNGWPLEYSRATGMPIRTSQRKEEAKEIFGDDVSYFYYSSNGLRAILRDFFYDGADGPFCVSAYFEPDSRYPCVGARACRRSEQDAERLATPR